MRTDIKRFIYKFLVVSFSSLIVFSCEKKSEEPKTVITVTTSSISQITQTSAKSGGSMTITGNATIDGKGICWSTSNNPTVSLSTKTADGTGSSSYTSSLIGLTPSTTYYVRAYATYSEGVVYGNELTFTTGTVVLPTVTTSSITNITQTTATVGGNVTSDGGATVTERGVCYSTTQNPTVDNSKVQIGSGTGTFTSNITGLTANTTYYVRAYAKNSVGVYYGSQVSFTTLSIPVAPSVSFELVNTFTNYIDSIQVVGKLTSTGSSNVTRFGVCYTGKNTTPTVNDSVIYVDGYLGVNDEFTMYTKIVNAGKTYNCRVYAINNAGISYSETKTFTTGSLDIGKYYKDGIIAYINGSSGLIIAKTDQGTAAWSNDYTHISTSFNIGDGKTNTDNIISAQGSGSYAAKLCRNLGADWFLPSLYELQKIWYNKENQNIGITSGIYWSSSEYTSDSNKAICYDFSKPISEPYFASYHTDKYTTRKVRAVRYF